MWWELARRFAQSALWAVHVLAALAFLAVLLMTKSPRQWMRDRSVAPPRPLRRTWWERADARERLARMKLRRVGQRVRRSVPVVPRAPVRKGEGS